LQNLLALSVSLERSFNGFNLALMRRTRESAAKAYLIFEMVRRVSDPVKHGTISFCHLVMSAP
jgi:hypothetical protein